MDPSHRSVRPTAFFALTYILSWLIWIPLDLSHFDVGPFHVLEGASGAVRLLGVLMPAVAGLVLTRRAAGRTGLGDLVRRLAAWRVRWTWWGAAVLLQPALLVLVYLVYNGLWAQPRIEPAAVGSAAAFIVNVFFLLVATLGEEIGWRGVALPTLQARRGPRGASAILGLLWAAWHIPFWLLLDTFDQFGMVYLALSFLMILPATFYITWFFNAGRGSLLLPVAFHLVFNIVNTALLPVTLNVGAFALFVALEWVVALAVLPGMGRAAPLLAVPRGRTS